MALGQKLLPHPLNIIGNTFGKYKGFGGYFRPRVICHEPQYTCITIIVLYARPYVYNSTLICQ